MKRIRFRDFEKTYDLNMLLHSLSSYKVGHKVEWKSRLRRTYEIEQAFFTDFLNLPEKEAAEAASWLLSANKAPKEEASFAAIDMIREKETQPAFNIPTLGLRFQGNLNTSTILSFAYEGIKVLSLRDEIRSGLRKMIAGLTRVDKGQLRKIGNIGFIDQLFYAGKVVLDVDKGHQAAMELELSKQNLGYDLQSNGTSTIRVAFSNNPMCPFAARFESVADLLD